MGEKAGCLSVVLNRSAWPAAVVVAAALVAAAVSVVRSGLATRECGFKGSFQRQ